MGDNIVAWNADGIGVIGQDRGNATWNNVVNMQIRGNTIAMAPRSGDAVGPRRLPSPLRGPRTHL